MESNNEVTEVKENTINSNEVTEENVASSNEVTEIKEENTSGNDIAEANTVNNKCQIVRDLLPLYQDNVCSEESRRMVDEHLKDCKDCKTIADELSKTELDDTIIKEKNSVLLKHSKREKRRSGIVGAIFAITFMVPIVVCLICNLATGHNLDWFFIVLASLGVLASVTVVPYIVYTNRFIWTTAAFSLTTFILLYVINKFAHGNWFALVAFPCLLGFTLVFLPIALCKVKLPKFLDNKKALISMLIDTVMVYAVIGIIGVYAQGLPGAHRYYDIAFKITTFSFIYPWIVFIIIRYIRCSGRIKAGVIALFSGIFALVENSVVNAILEGQYVAHIDHFNLLDWNLDTINGNIYVLVLIACSIAGIALIISGIVGHKESK